MSNTWQSRAWVEVDLDAVPENFTRIRRAVGPEPGIIAPPPAPLPKARKGTAP